MIRRIAATLLTLACGIAFAQAPADPLAGLENPAAPQTETFYREQASATRAVLDRVAGREALRQRIAQLSGSQVLVSGLAEGGPRYFYLRRDAGSQSARLVMREGVGGAERLVLDPATLAHDAAHASLAWI